MGIWGNIFAGLSVLISVLVVLIPQLIANSQFKRNMLAEQIRKTCNEYIKRANELIEALDSSFSFDYKKIEKFSLLTSAVDNFALVANTVTMKSTRKTYALFSAANKDILKLINKRAFSKIDDTSLNIIEEILSELTKQKGLLLTAISTEITNFNVEINDIISKNKNYRDHAE